MQAAHRSRAVALARARDAGDEPHATPEEILLAAERDRHVRDLVAELRDRGRWLVETMFGLGEQEGDLTITELADVLDVSRSRANQVVRVALTRLAKRLAAEARKEGEAPAAFWGQRPT